MTNITIRAATEADLPTLLSFEQGIIEFERPFDSTLKESPISYYDIAAMLKAEDAYVVVAECANRVVASGLGHIIDSKPYLKHPRQIALRFMYVAEDFRGQGINQQIMQALKDWGLSKGVSEMRLTVYVENHGAIRAYEKAGFSQNMVEMRIDTKS